MMAKSCKAEFREKLFKLVYFAKTPEEVKAAWAELFPKTDVPLDVRWVADELMRLVEISDDDPEIRLPVPTPLIVAAVLGLNRTIKPGSGSPPYAGEVERIIRSANLRRKGRRARGEKVESQAEFIEGIQKSMAKRGKIDRSKETIKSKLKPSKQKSQTSE